jgi:hypothetical protein
MKEPKNFHDINESSKYIFYLYEVANNLKTSEFKLAKQNIIEKYDQVRRRLQREFDGAFIRQEIDKIE